jgi:hypothetical protein
MQSKNKRAMTKAERTHVTLLKGMACGVCQAPAPSEAHEIEQGLWFTSVPLCSDCHRGARNGIHGQRTMWNVFKATELGVLNDTIGRLLYG